MPVEIVDPPSYKILNPAENIHRHAILEASAGTGKTFAIENLVLRLLTEERQHLPPLELDKILIVTFTRAATGDLKSRIRKNLEKALSIAKRFIETKELLNGVHDYLLPHFETHEKALLLKRRIEKALFTFNEANIFTIHGFCAKMLKSFALESGVALSAKCEEDEPLVAKDLFQAAGDFLRIGFSKADYSSSQLKIILKRFTGDVGALQNELLAWIGKGVPITSYASFENSYAKLMLARENFLKLHPCTPESVMEEILALAPFYKKLPDQKNVTAAERLNSAAFLFKEGDYSQEDFNKLIEHGLTIDELFHPDNMKKNVKRPSPSSLINEIIKTFSPILDEASNSSILFCRLASDCQRFIGKFQKKEELFGHTALLHTMLEAVLKPSFAKKVRNAFEAVIVDEFQDTDPIQWRIFKELFVGGVWNGFLTIVGDPKQSIYAFRHADIYTYLEAASCLGEGSYATLNTNYRSQPQLIEALNTLFSSLRSVFPLPKLSSSLPYRQVFAGVDDRKCYEGDETPVTFLIAKDEEEFLPYIAEEILRLRSRKIPLKEIAILVADRYQGQHVEQFLKQKGISTKSQRGASLCDSKALSAFIQLLHGVIFCKRKGSLKEALCCKAIGYTHQELLELDEVYIFEKVQKMRQILFEEGFAKFYNVLMNSCWKGERELLANLLVQEDGLDFYHDWQDIAELLIAEEKKQTLSPQGLIDYLKLMKEGSHLAEEAMKGYLDLDEEGVNVLTTHVSKGLEFEAVFALGLIKRTPSPRGEGDDKLLAVERQENLVIASLPKSDPLYLRHVEELDAEKMRQLYVALTRAKSRVYISAVFGGKLPLGRASPVELMVAKLSDFGDSYQELYRRIEEMDETVLLDFAAQHSTLMAVRIMSEATNFQSIDQPIENEELVKPNQVVIAAEEKKIQSFTSIAQAIPKASPLDVSLSAAPHDFNIEDKNEHTLPSGADTGILLHTILENVRFDAFRNMEGIDEALPLILPFLQNTPFLPWQRVIAKMILRSLTTKLPGVSFSLSEVDPDCLYREAEFLYPIEGASFCGVSLEGGFLKGVMDLCFWHQGKYYLVDWKSNWLGGSSSAYEKESLQAAILDNRYDLQAKVYEEALRRYLTLLGYNFDRDFGGTFYFFLRGTAPLLVI